MNIKPNTTAIDLLLVEATAIDLLLVEGIDLNNWKICPQLVRRDFVLPRHKLYSEKFIDLIIDVAYCFGKIGKTILCTSAVEQSTLTMVFSEHFLFYLKTIMK